ncbi:hypothetical protein T484DRAFT_1804939, partial [Baffinella frigidus]
RAGQHERASARRHPRPSSSSAASSPAAPASPASPARRGDAATDLRGRGAASSSGGRVSGSGSGSPRGSPRRDYVRPAPSVPWTRDSAPPRQRPQTAPHLRSGRAQLAGSQLRLGRTSLADGFGGGRSSGGVFSPRTPPAGRMEIFGGRLLMSEVSLTWS